MTFDIPAYLGPTDEESYVPEYTGPTDSVSYANALSVRLRDSPETVRGWRLVSISFSCIPDACYPPDWAIVNAARENDPDLIYMVARWTFRPEGARSDGGQTQTFTRHALGRHVPVPAADKELFHVEMPADATFPVPNQLDRMLPDFDEEIVPSYGALEWDVYWNPWVQLSDKEFRQRYVVAPQERAAKEKQAVLIEMEYRRREAQKFWNKCLENVADWEIDQWIEKNRLAKAAHLRRERAARRAHNARLKAERGAPKLILDLGGH